MDNSAPAWWRSAVIYQVYPRSFADANGDGIGDLPGVTARLGHLAYLGVDAIWLSPFYRSPMIDGGYDVADYRDVDPMFGTLADFDAMLAEAHRLDLRVIVDIVPNHSSSAHPWFVEALAAPPGSPVRERYIFRPGRGADGAEPPNNWQSIFRGPAWTRVADGEWYLHLFDPSQPDFNWRSPEVSEDFQATLRFWLDRGVDGFRIDVAHGMAKAEGLPDVEAFDGRAEHNRVPYFDQDDVHEIYREWRKILDSYPGDRMAVAETWAASPERLARYIAGDELHQAFNFDYLDAPWSAPDIRAIVDTSLGATALVGGPTTWVLSNHDRRRHVTRYGGGELGLRRARAAIMLMLALPGSAYIYQGEELGLPEVLDLPDGARQDPVWFRSDGTDIGRDGCRVPIPWSGDAPPYGFGPTDRPPSGGGASWLPQPDDWGPLSVAAQSTDPSSMLSLYRSALRLRRAHWVPAGDLTWLSAADDEVLVFERGGGLVCAANLSDAPRTLPAYGRTLLASGPVTGTVLPADTTVWWLR